LTSRTASTALPAASRLAGGFLFDAFCVKLELAQKILHA